MPTSPAFADDFTFLDWSTWYASDFTVDGDWLHTDWTEDSVSVADGIATLSLTRNEPDDPSGKTFSGAEMQTVGFYGYGTYEIRMRASSEPGVNSSFFTYTGINFLDPWHEVDVEILGSDPTKAMLAYHTDEGSFEYQHDLGFDASADFHTYAFEWLPDRITWTIDGVEVFSVDDTGVPLPSRPSKVYANIWSGLPSRLGEAGDFDETSAEIDYIRHTPLGEDPVPFGSNAVHGLRIELLTRDGIVLATLEDGDRLDSAIAEAGSLSIRVTPTGNALVSATESVAMDLSGPVNKTKVESFAPYALFGDRGITYFGKSFGEGDYTFNVQAFSEDDALGELLAQETISFSIGGSPFTVTVVDAATGQPLALLEDDGTLDLTGLATSDLSFLVEFTDRSVAAAESAVFGLSGPLSHTQVENHAPYALFGNSSTEIHGRDFTPGNYTLDLKAFSERNAEGALLAEDTFDFTIVASDPQPFTVTLIDADKDIAIGTVTDGSVIDAGALDLDNFSLEVAMTEGKAGSIGFALSGERTRNSVENYEPFALFGDRAGPDFHGQPADPGNYTLSLTAYAGAAATGEAFATLDMEFQIV